VVIGSPACTATLLYTQNFALHKRKEPLPFLLPNTHTLHASRPLVDWRTAFSKKINNIVDDGSWEDCATIITLRSHPKNKYGLK
jgi:hypothetical protein